MDQSITIVLGADHAGFELKEKIKAWLKELGYRYMDKGASSFNGEDDYPDFIRRVAAAVSRHPTKTRGIILGGSGQGEAMAANRYDDVRAAVYYGGSMDIVRLSREHNDANVLSLGARFVSEEEARKAVKLWLETSFSGEERHVRRIQKIEELFD